MIMDSAERWDTTALLWIPCVALAAHLLYSGLGFNPTDDGFVLAYSRRLLDGQIPHRDFVMIRPWLSPALHIPEVLAGGDYTLWLSRFVFFIEAACIAWFGTVFVKNGIRQSFTSTEQPIVALLSFVLCCHSFPAMAWHTIDGVLLCVIGMSCRSLPSARAKPIGYFLMGAACLCKQSFLFGGPGMLLVYGDWRKWRCVGAFVLPGLVTSVALLLVGAAADARLQLLAQTGIFEVGVQAYRDAQLYMGLVVGLIPAMLLFSNSPGGWPAAPRLRRAVGCALCAAAVGLAMKRLYDGRLFASSFALFGMVGGVVLYLTLEVARSQMDTLRTGAAVSLLAWSTSLSIGYNSPVLGSGILAAYVLALVCQQSAWRGLRPGRRSLASVAVVALALWAFHHARTYHIYREQPASVLTGALGDVMRGGQLIRTNENTQAFLKDLNMAVGRVQGRGMTYAILPDIAAHWVTSEQPNPLPIDWAQSTELSTKALAERITKSLEGTRSEEIVIVQKFQASALASGFVDLQKSDESPAVTYVRMHFEKIESTQYFDLYR